jgi:hypothetical protein
LSEGFIRGGKPAPHEKSMVTLKKNTEGERHQCIAGIESVEVVIVLIAGDFSRLRIGPPLKHWNN